MANQMKFSGKVTAISEPLIGENGKWQSVMVVVTEDKEQYPQSIAVECFNKQSELEKIAIGTVCDVYFNIEASEYKGKYYGKNKLWKFDNVEMPQCEKPTQAPQTVTAGDDKDLPFN
jgi:hypothetical protein